MFKDQFLAEQIILPKSTPAKKMVLFLHGLGSNGDDLISLAPFMADKLPDTVFISPNGIENCDMGGFGYQWFSLKNRDPKILLQELNRIRPTLNDYIDKKLEEYKLSPKDLTIVGFSQGTMTALNIIFTRAEAIGGIVGFSGSLINDGNVKPANKTPVCLIHGIYDDVVAFSNMAAAALLLREYNIECETHPIANLMHSINEKGIEYAIKFIKQHS